MKHLEVSTKKTAEQLLNKRDIFSSTWRDVLDEANELGVSDIHVEAVSEGLRIRFRHKGDLFLHQLIEEKDIVGQTFVRLKEIAGLDISLMNDVQDGAFELQRTRSRYRVALGPSNFGESLVIRSIRDEDIPHLSAICFPDELVDDLRWALNQKQGFICVTGPTGSGKSTTVQAAINHIDRDRKKVITLEDPIERVLPGVVQQQISSRLTWTKGIKLALRQDPDVIFVGEIRDRESATLALEAAQTGHLVLSTLHTNDAARTIERLRGLGVNPSLLADNIVAILAQRLVQILCENCRTAEEGWQKGPGCTACNNTGIASREPVVEYCIKPSRESILDFDAASFRKSELKASLAEITASLYKEGKIELGNLYKN